MFAPPTRNRIAMPGCGHLGLPQTQKGRDRIKAAGPRPAHGTSTTTTLETRASDAIILVVRPRACGDRGRDATRVFFMPRAVLYHSTGLFGISGSKLGPQA